MISFKRSRTRYFLAGLSLLLVLIVFGSETTLTQRVDASPIGFVITGRLIDSQNQPVDGADVSVYLPGEIGAEAATDDEDLKGFLLAEAESQEDGSWAVVLPEVPQDELRVSVERYHFQLHTVTLDSEELALLGENGTFTVGEWTLARKISAGFWAATIIFIAVLLIIALEWLHSTIAALAGLSMIFLVSFIGVAFDSDLYIFSFERALSYINWEVIFLVMGMMIIIAIIERTGIFQWMAFQAYRLSRGRTWLLVLILMLLTAVASALLDNFTTMLLMTPISLQIGLALGINPLALIIPEVLASNVGGISTLIGTPTNILIGAYADIGFTDFLVNQTGGVLLALVVMAGYVLFHYRKEWRKHSGGISPKLYALLEKNAQLDDPQALWKSGLVFLLVMVGFVVGEQYHIVPAVPALLGATLLLVWLKPDVHSMINAVDWTTLVFFMALFMVVGAVQEVGLISYIADVMSRLVADNLVLGIIVIVFGVGTISTLIANIPVAASMLPVVEFLTGTVPGANSKVLYYALSMGAAMGGNGTLVGAEANLVTAGITEQADSRISFKEFLKVGLPVTYLTLTAGCLWLLLRFVVLGN